MRLPVGILCLSLVAPVLARADDVKKDGEKIKGNWSVVSFERNGDKLPDEVTREWKLTFSADKLTLKVSDGDKEASFKLDPAQKPKHFDVTPKEGEKKDQVLKGIYELDGDNLKLCVADTDQDARPTEFKSPAGSTLIFLVLKRDK